MKTKTIIYQKNRVVTLNATELNSGRNNPTLTTMACTVSSLADSIRK